MRLVLITCVLWCACAGGGVAGAGGGRLLAKLVRHHHKRGALGTGGVPTFKLGHDIPRVTHSVIKPFVVTYPPAATVSAVKVPLTHPLIQRHPPPPPPRLPLTPQHFHHHHHHVPAAPRPRPVVPVVPPPPPPPPVLLPARPSPLLPPPHVSPLLPAASVSLQPAPVVPAPVAAYAPQVQYVLRPGSAVQTSVFATYPRYPVPFASYRPAVPLGPVASYAPNLIFGQPALAALPPAPAVFSTAASSVPLAPLPPSPPPPPPPLALHPAPIEHDGWAPLPSHPHDVPLNVPHLHYSQGAQFAHDTQSQTHFAHEVQDHSQFAHDFQAHAQFAHDAQSNAQYGHDAQVHAQLAHDAQAQAQYEHDAHVHAQFVQNAQAQAQFAHEADVNVYNQEQYAHGYNNPDVGNEDGGGEQHYHELQQHVQHQLEQLEGHRQRVAAAEYGAPPPPAEGRSESSQSGPDDDDQLRYHNHIPLGLQPPLDRPLEHFH